MRSNGRLSLLERPDTDVVSDISVAWDGIISPDLEVAVTEDQPRPVGPVLLHLPVPALAQLGGADPSPGSSVSLYIVLGVQTRLDTL